MYLSGYTRGGYERSILCIGLFRICCRNSKGWNEKLSFYFLPMIDSPPWIPYLFSVSLLLSQIQLLPIQQLLIQLLIFQLIFQPCLHKLQTNHPIPIHCVHRLTNNHLLQLGLHKPTNHPLHHYYLLRQTCLHLHHQHLHKLKLGCQQALHYCHLSLQ